MVALSFDFPTWIGRFPEFKNIDPIMGQNYFEQATILLDDTFNYLTGAPDPMLSQLLYLATSHVAWLFSPKGVDGNPDPSGSVTPGIVGRITSASQGSVNVSVEGGGASSSPSQAWFEQTRYGSMFWAMTAGLRTARYVPSLRAVVSGIYTGRRGVY